jgi:hypothetical protein
MIDSEGAGCRGALVLRYPSDLPVRLDTVCDHVLDRQSSSPCILRRFPRPDLGTDSERVRYKGNVNTQTEKIEMVTELWNGRSEKRTNLTMRVEVISK